MSFGGPAGFGDHLRRLRLRARLTQRELAELAGLSHRTLSDLERGVNALPRRDSARMLADALDLAPAERANFLEAARGRWRAAPGARHPGGSPVVHGFPAAPGPIFGRARELALIDRALTAPDVRLVTLRGAGGVGKSRLAFEAARAAANRFPDGVFVIRLDGHTDAETVLPAIAQALQFAPGADGAVSGAWLASRLSKSNVLLVLDTFEHLLGATPDLVTLLDEAPGVTCLVTSRELLGARGEWSLRVEPLPRSEPGAADDPATQLFLHHAARVRPTRYGAGGPSPDHPERRIVAAICNLLDGLPLAIELASAQAQFLSLPTILAILEETGLSLLHGDGNRPPRHRGVENAVAWSYRLLDPGEQALFRNLAVFLDGFDLPAAAAVAASGRPRSGDPSFNPLTPLRGIDPALVKGIASLARKHLLVEEPAPPGHSDPRFRMLEPIRRFALSRLQESGEEAAARTRHAEHFAAVAMAIDPLTLGANPARWIARLAADIGNLRVAQDWSTERGRHDLAACIAAYSSEMWSTLGLHTEARARLASALANDVRVRPEDRWFLRYWAGTFALQVRRVEEALRHAEEVIAIAEHANDRLGLGAGLALRSQALGALPDRHAEALELADRAIACLAVLDEPAWNGWAIGRRSIELHRLGLLEEARASHLRALDVRRGHALDLSVPCTLAGLGSVLIDLGEPVPALDAYHEALDLAIRHDDRWLAYLILVGLADVAVASAAGNALIDQAAGQVIGIADRLAERFGFERAHAAAPALRSLVAAARAGYGHDPISSPAGFDRPLSADDIMPLADALRDEIARSRPSVALPRASAILLHPSIE